MRPWSRPRDHDDHQHDVRQPHRKRFAYGAECCDESAVASDARLERSTAKSANRPRPPDFDKEKHNPERSQRPAEVRKIGSEVVSNWPLTCDVRQRRDDRQRPCFGDAHPSAHQKDQDPRRQQSENRDKIAYRGRKREQRQSRNGREPDDRGSQRAERYRRVIRERGNSYGIQVGDSQAHQNRNHDRPRIAESHEPFQEARQTPRPA